MILDDAGHAALLDWIDLSTRLRRAASEAKQADLLERLRTVAGEHQANARRLEEIRAAREQKAADAARLEADVTARGTMIASQEAKLASGDGLTSRDLVTLQSEIETARHARSDVEDEQLAVLGELEALDEQIAAAQETGDRLAEQGRTLQTERAEVAGRLESEIAELTEQRSAVRKRLPAELAGRLERREAAGEVGAALVAHGSCGACGAELSGMARDRLAGAQAGETVDCDDCEAVLVRP